MHQVSDEVVVRIENLTKSFDELEVLRGVNVNVHRGEVVVILGPSGAGKTTVLNMLGGMDTCDEGEIWLDGQLVSRYSPKELTAYRRHDVGFVFQFYNLVQNLTALENVELASEICKEPLDAAETLEEVGLGYVKLGQPSTELSGGEAQRVKLATELSKQATGKTIYILDEPTTGLHSDDVRKLLEVLQRLVDAGNTVVVIEHNLDIIKCADHLIDLGPEGGDGGGTIVVTGTPEEVAACPASFTGQYLKRMLN